MKKIFKKWFIGLLAIAGARGLIYLIELFENDLGPVSFAYLLTFFSLAFYEVILSEAEK